MLKRAIETALFDWAQNDASRALLVTGARQIGKSFSLAQLGMQAFDHTAIIDFVEQPQARAALANTSSYEEFKTNLSLLTRAPLDTPNTLVIFDEIQACPNALTMIKYLVKDAPFRVALSGSLLGTQLENVDSLPVGSIRQMQMYPLSFTEFAWSQGVEPSIFTQVQNCLQTTEQIPAFIHTKLMQLWRLYLVVGGMPQAVQEYTNSKNLQLVRSIQEDIKLLYAQDITKYAPKESRLLIRDIYNSIPSQLKTNNPRFMLSKVPQVKRFNTADTAFTWLTQAGVALDINQVSAIEAPLTMQKKLGRLKLYLSDVGLFTSTFSDKVALETLTKNNLNEGVLFENAVAQQLTTTQLPLFYYAQKNKGELDFVAETKDGELVGIECKSGEHYMRHATLDKVLENRDFRLDKAFVLSTHNIQKAGRIVYAPLYTSQFLLSE